ncbi:MAG: hypothetical protein RMZ42_31485 [Nostoc sp. DedQUE05]|uniref:hypothetical protein n=1 Tax=Nostoc sp. DedQUE05 TaxID=3075391 RepID=UPI002AD37075|nr:hypothetical protein [Nostoc sp. DedQUE05]MDZ8096425.1 hypothetical protein [Nostoc sp. DedQUE05]
MPSNDNDTVSKTGIFVLPNNKYLTKVQSVVNSFQEYELPKIFLSHKTGLHLNEEVNYFIVAAGKGKRLKALTQLVGDYTKACFPFPLNNYYRDMYVADFPLALGTSFVNKTGYDFFTCPPNGNISGVINYYLRNPQNIKATLISGVDLVYDSSSQEIAEFIEIQLKQPSNHLAFIGTEKRLNYPSSVGIFRAEKTSISESAFTFIDFIENPSPEEFRSCILPNGNHIVNTGLVYFSKLAVTKLMDKVRQEIENQGCVTFLKKNDSEIYNGAHAITYILKNMDKLFGEKSKKQPMIKMVINWEDVGTVKSYFRFLSHVKNGLYLQNFSPDYAKAIWTSVSNRVSIEPNQKKMLFSPRYFSIEDIPENEHHLFNSIEGISVFV